jgi:aryl-alcohol dehydrogenase-like predicted oxidoreductase
MPAAFLPTRPCGQTGLALSLLGLGTVKWGRNQGVKYPAFELPTDAALHALLDVAAAAGVNYLDTAPAYGIAQERVGKILAERSGHPFHVFTKTGECFADGNSTFDFSVGGTEASLTASLRQLHTECLDAVQVHCPPEDVACLTQTPVLETLRTWQQRGHLRHIGISTMTVEGGLLAVELADFVMVPFSVGYQVHRPVIEKANTLQKGVLVKRALYSGPALEQGRSLQEHLQAALGEPGVSSVVAGTITPKHLAENIAQALLVSAAA